MQMKNIRDLFKNRCYPDWPKSSTMEEWAAWHKIAREKKLCYWLSTTIPTFFSVKMMQLNDVKYWFKYRLQKKHRYHLIDTGLSPKYYEIETRMLHGMFNILKEYVEIEKATLHYLSIEKGDVKPSKRQAGLNHLEWEIGLTYDDYPDPELAGKPTLQAEGAQQVKDLYLWWMDVRPNRIDPYDDDYMKAKVESRKGKKDFYDLFIDRTEEEKAAQLAFWDKKQAIEDAYDKEDEEMLKVLVSIRQSLWT
jgi:hypothetical protein